MKTLTAGLLICLLATTIAGSPVPPAPSPADLQAGVWTIHICTEPEDVPTRWHEDGRITDPIGFIHLGAFYLNSDGMWRALLTIGGEETWVRLVPDGGMYETWVLETMVEGEWVPIGMMY